MTSTITKAYKEGYKEGYKAGKRKAINEDYKYMDNGFLIQKLDALIDDMESTEVTDFADDLRSVTDSAYDYGFNDREICEQYWSIWKEMKHTRDPVILDFADELYDLVQPYIEIARDSVDPIA